MSESITIRDYYDMNKTIFAFAFSLCQFTYSDIRVTSVERMQYGINEKKIKWHSQSYSKYCFTCASHLISWFD